MEPTRDRKCFDDSMLDKCSLKGEAILMDTWKKTVLGQEFSEIEDPLLRKIHEQEEEEQRDIDQGWAWMILLGGFLAFSLLSGLYNTFSIQYVVLLKTFKESRGYTATVGAMYSAFFFLGGPVSTYLIFRFGCRITIVLGGILSALGYILSSVAPNLALVVFTYGILAAIGLSFNFSGWVITLGTYFQKKHAIATALAMTGFGCGLFFLGPLMELNVTYYGWSGSLLINAGLALQFCVFGLLVYPVRMTVYEYAESGYLCEWVGSGGGGEAAPSSTSPPPPPGKEQRVSSAGPVVLDKKVKEIRVGYRQTSGSIKDLQLCPSSSFLSHSINSLCDMDLSRRRSSSFMSLPIYHSEEVLSDEESRDRCHSFAESILRRPEKLRERIEKRKLEAAAQRASSREVVPAAAPKEGKKRRTKKPAEREDKSPRRKTESSKAQGLQKLLPKSVQQLKKIHAKPLRSWHSDIMEEKEEDSQADSNPENTPRTDAPPSGGRDRRVSPSASDSGSEPRSADEAVSAAPSSGGDDADDDFLCDDDDGDGDEDRPPAEPRFSIAPLASQESIDLQANAGQEDACDHPGGDDFQYPPHPHGLSPFDRHLLADVKFWCFNMSGMLWVMSTMTLYVLYKDFASSRGFTERFIYALSGIGLGDLLGRLIAGTICSWSFVNSVCYYSIAQMLCGAAVLYHNQISTMEGLIALCVTMGSFHGQLNVLLAVAPGHVYGPNNLALVFGYILFFCGLGALLGPPVAGSIYDVTQSYEYAFHFAGFATLLGGAVSMVCYVLHRRQMKQEKLSKKLRTRRKSSILVT